MTIADLYYRSTNIDEYTFVQLFKRSEACKYYDDDLENLSFNMMHASDLSRSSAKVDNFWFHKFDDEGFVTLVFILLEDDTL